MKLTALVLVAQLAHPVAGYVGYENCSQWRDYLTMLMQMSRDQRNKLSLDAMLAKRSGDIDAVEYSVAMSALNFYEWEVDHKITKPALILRDAEGVCPISKQKDAM